MANIGHLIYTYRKKRGITQTQLAKAVGRAQNEIWRWEHGVGHIRAEDLPLIAQALGISILDFFKESNPALARAKAIADE